MSKIYTNKEFTLSKTQILNSSSSIVIQEKEMIKEAVNGLIERKNSFVTVCTAEEADEYARACAFKGYQTDYVDLRKGSKLPFNLLELIKIGGQPDEVGADMIVELLDEKKNSSIIKAAMGSLDENDFSFRGLYKALPRMGLINWFEAPGFAQKYINRVFQLFYKRGVDVETMPQRIALQASKVVIPEQYLTQFSGDKRISIYPYRKEAHALFIIGEGKLAELVINMLIKKDGMSELLSKDKSPIYFVCGAEYIDSEIILPGCDSRGQRFILHDPALSPKITRWADAVVKKEMPKKKRKRGFLSRSAVYTLVIFMVTGLTMFFKLDEYTLKMVMPTTVTAAGIILAAVNFVRYNDEEINMRNASVATGMVVASLMLSKCPRR